MKYRDLYWNRYKIGYRPITSCCNIFFLKRGTTLRTTEWPKNTKKRGSPSQNGISGQPISDQRSNYIFLFTRPSMTRQLTCDSVSKVASPADGSF